MPRVAALVLAIAAGCGAAAPNTWQVHATAAGPVYEYTEDTKGYAPGDPGGYLVLAKDDTPAGRRALRTVLAGFGTVDEAASGGFVVRLTDAALVQVALAPGVASVAPLAADARRGELGAGDGTIVATIDLFDDARPEEIAAVAAWLTAHGAQLAQTGGTIVGTMSAAVAREAARLGPVRWVAARVGDEAEAAGQAR
ncbi:MAG: hypothetical protein K8W52_13810 [Deltaproteobacteria bacterium]|nr:hypothetical protein [Deltaproteobacteria bacterium]